MIAVDLKIEIDTASSRMIVTWTDGISFDHLALVTKLGERIIGRGGVIATHVRIPGGKGVAMCKAADVLAFEGEYHPDGAAALTDAGKWRELASALDVYVGFLGAIVKDTGPPDDAPDDIGELEQAVRDRVNAARVALGLGGDR